ncbi:MAG TPA: hypothetical protein QGH10_21850 [Armatimonadota bacterium]|nr:hypothetical protein [Armatimonadota bacterium]
MCPRLGGDREFRETPEYLQIFHRPLVYRGIQVASAVVLIAALLHINGDLVFLPGAILYPLLALSLLASGATSIVNARGEASMRNAESTWSRISSEGPVSGLSDQGPAAFRAEGACSIGAGLGFGVWYLMSLVGAESTGVKAGIGVAVAAAIVVWVWTWFAFPTYED